MPHIDIDLGTAAGRDAARAEGLPVPPEVDETLSRRGTREGRPGVQRSRKRQKRDDLTPEQRAFLKACEAHSLPEPVCEYQFAKPRKWRFDYCWPEGDIAVEIQGGLFSAGRHVRGAALLNEYAKLNAAVLEGWAILFFTPQQVGSGECFPVIRRALGL